MQRIHRIHIAAFKVLLVNDLKPCFGFETRQYGLFGNASGNLAIVMIAAFRLKSIGINCLPILFIGKRLKPFFDFLHVIEFYHELRIPNFRFLAQALFEERRSAWL